MINILPSGANLVSFLLFVRFRIDFFGLLTLVVFMLDIFFLKKKKKAEFSYSVET